MAVEDASVLPLVGKVGEHVVICDRFNTLGGCKQASVAVRSSFSLIADEHGVGTSRDGHTDAAVEAVPFSFSKWANIGGLLVCLEENLARSAVAVNSPHNDRSALRQGFEVKSKHELDAVNSNVHVILSKGRKTKLLREFNKAILD